MRRRSLGLGRGQRDVQGPGPRSLLRNAPVDHGHRALRAAPARRGQDRDRGGRGGSQGRGDRGARQARRQVGPGLGAVKVRARRNRRSARRKGQGRDLEVGGREADPPQAVGQEVALEDGQGAQIEAPSRDQGSKAGTG